MGAQQPGDSLAPAGGLRRGSFWRRRQEGDVCLHTAGPCCVAFPQDGPGKSLEWGVLCHRTPASCSASPALLDSVPFSQPQLLPITSFLVAAWHALARLTPDAYRDLARQLEPVLQEVCVN